MARSRLAPSSSRQPWLGALVVVVALVVSAFALVSEVGDEAKPPFLTPGAVAAAPPIPNDGRVRLAGSGSNLPLTRAIAAAFVDSGGDHPVIHASIGSGGGLRALLDGAIDIALISRPLGDAERAQGFYDTPYARMPIAVTVHSAVPDTNVSVEQLLAMYRGDRTTWSDGSPVVVLQREPGDSSHAALNRVLPQFAAVNDEAYRQNRWRVLYHDAAMDEALETTEGAIGLHGSGPGPAGQGFREMTIDGVAPSVEACERGDYLFTKTLSFVTVGPPRDAAADLIDFSLSPRGHASIRAFGAVPLPVAGREG